MVAMMTPCAFAAEEAEVNGTKYSSLQDAIDNTAKGTITLLNDVELSNQLVFTNGKNITLDLNGHSISRTNNVVMVQNAHLTVTGTGKISETAPDYTLQDAANAATRSSSTAAKSTRCNSPKPSPSK